MLDKPDLAFHLSVAELSRACAGRLDLTEQARTAEAVHVLASASVPPPVIDGERFPKPPHEFPANVAAATSALMTYREPVPSAEPRGDHLRGIGIGTAVVQGRARVAHNAIAGSDALEPGDIVVTSITDSAFNVLLTMVGGVVTEFGGANSHAALMARELGMTAIVGVEGVVARIPNGALIELDPATGEVRIVDGSGRTVD